jgi:hypothetical protein
VISILKRTPTTVSLSLPDFASRVISIRGLSSTASSLPSLFDTKAAARRVRWPRRARPPLTSSATLSKASQHEGEAHDGLADQPAPIDRQLPVPEVAKEGAMECYRRGREDLLYLGAALQRHGKGGRRNKGP